MNLPRFAAVIFLLATFPLGLFAQEETSENNKRLKMALKRFPEADTNKDGILSRTEAKAHMAKMGMDPAALKKEAGSRVPSSPVTVSGKDVPEGQAIQGLNGLYMGHSFFKPAAMHLLKVIPQTQVVNHTEFIVFSGGSRGSPERMWESEKNRARGQEYLNENEVDIMVMTYFSPENSSVEDYARWFDYATERHPDITFMVTIPWDKNPHQATPEQIEGADARYKEIYEDLIVPLRAKYPKNRILYCPYGLGVYELIRRFNDDNLPGVKYVLNPDKAKRIESRIKKEQILNDPLGHGGDLVTQLNALIWLQTIYNYDISTLPRQTVEGLPDIDLNEIAETVYKKIPKYNAPAASPPQTDQGKKAENITE